MVEGLGSRPMGMRENVKRPVRHAAAIATLAAVQLVVALASPPLAAQSGGGDVRPYDTKLMRLAEILGAVHYLRELCGANEGQTWRNRMQELIEGEGAASLRRAQLTSRFCSASMNFRSASAAWRIVIGPFRGSGSAMAWLCSR